MFNENQSDFMWCIALLKEMIKMKSIKFEKITIQMQ